MANLNKVMLIGNLTRDPQLSYLPSQTPVVEFGLAISRRYKKQDGSQGEETCFVDCQMFGKYRTSNFLAKVAAGKAVAIRPVALSPHRLQPLRKRPMVAGWMTTSHFKLRPNFSGGI